MTLATLGERMFMNSDYANVLLVCDGEEIPASREILSAASCYLWTVLRQNKSDKVIINNIPVKNFKEIIRYVYLGRLNIWDWSMKDVLELLALARNYQYDEVVSQVVIHLEERNLDFPTWDLLHSVATSYDLDILKSKCASFSEEKISEFINLQNLEKFEASFIGYMFESPKIQSCNQDELLEALLEWKKIHSVNQIKDIFFKITWKNVSSTILANIACDYFAILQNLENSSFWDAVSENRTKRKEKLHDVAANDPIYPVTTAVSTLFGVQQGNSLFSSNTSASRFTFAPPKGLSTSFTGVQKPQIPPSTFVAGFDFDQLNKLSYPAKADLSSSTLVKPGGDITGATKELNTEKFKLGNQLPGSTKKEAECIISLNDVLIRKNQIIEFSVPKYQCILRGYFDSNSIQFWFKKYDLEYEIPIKRIEWESPENYMVDEVFGSNLNFWQTEMIVSQATPSENCCKYSADINGVTGVYSIFIRSQQFLEMPEIRLQKLIIL